MSANQHGIVEARIIEKNTVELKFEFGLEFEMDYIGLAVLDCAAWSSNYKLGPFACGASLS
jgi:hypothetical protein